MKIVCARGDCDHNGAGWGDGGALPPWARDRHAVGAATAGAAEIAGLAKSIGAPHLTQNLSLSPAKAPQFGQYIFPSPAA